MAMSTVEIATADGLASHIATVLANGRITKVLVLVVTEVLRSRTGFMLAIDAHCSPGELERQQGEQSNGEPTTHAK